MKYLILIFLILQNKTFAISEVNYQENFIQKVLPLIETVPSQNFLGQNNIKINYKSLEKSIDLFSKKCIVLLPGRGEPIEKYGEVIYDLEQNENSGQFNYFLMDHRGQGSSDRMSSPLDMGHIDAFENYILDFEIFLQKLQLNEKCQEKILIAHSLGAGIGTGFLLKYPNYFQKVIFISPMLKIQTKPFPYSIAKAIVHTQKLLKNAHKFALNQKGYNPNLKFEDNRFTTSPERFKMNSFIHDKFPKTKIGGVSNQFIIEVMKATDIYRKKYNEITVPMLVFLAGIELYSDSLEMKKFCESNKNCQSTLFPTSKHEVLMDRDLNRNIALKKIVEFINH